MNKKRSKTFMKIRRCLIGHGDIKGCETIEQFDFCQKMIDVGGSLMIGHEKEEIEALLKHRKEVEFPTSVQDDDIDSVRHKQTCGIK